MPSHFVDLYRKELSKSIVQIRPVRKMHFHGIKTSKGIRQHRRCPRSVFMLAPQMIVVHVYRGLHRCSNQRLVRGGVERCHLVGQYA